MVGIISKIPNELLSYAGGWIGCEQLSSWVSSDLKKGVAYLTCVKVVLRNYPAICRLYIPEHSIKKSRSKGSFYSLFFVDIWQKLCISIRL